ncbi:MAG: histidinol dehydrogenase, partial [Sphingobacterium sp.]
MLKKHSFLELTDSEIDRLVTRNSDDTNAIQDTVLHIIDQVRNQGDSALIELTRKFDKVNLNALFLDKDEIADLATTITRDQQRALEIAF